MSVPWLLHEVNFYHSYYTSTITIVQSSYPPGNQHEVWRTKLLPKPRSKHDWQHRSTRNYQINGILSRINPGWEQETTRREPVLAKEGWFSQSGLLEGNGKRCWAWLFLYILWDLGYIYWHVTCRKAYRDECIMTPTQGRKENLFPTYCSYRLDQNQTLACL